MWIVHNWIHSLYENNSTVYKYSNIGGYHRQQFNIGRKIVLKWRHPFLDNEWPINWIYDLRRPFSKKKRNVKSTCLFNSPKELHITVLKPDGFPAACLAASAWHFFFLPECLYLASKRIQNFEYLL